jgi:hypothetical protein
MPLDGNTRNRQVPVSEPVLDDSERVSLCEILDRVLNKGVVVAGDATISVADIDLIYLGLHIVLSSIETARRGSSRAPVELGAGSGIGLEMTNGFH